MAKEITVDVFNVYENNGYFEDKYYDFEDPVTSERFIAPGKTWGLGVQGKIEPMGRASDGFLGQGLGYIIGEGKKTVNDPWDNIRRWSEDVALAISTE